MNTHQKEEVAENSYFFETLGENRIVQWMIHNSKILLGVVGLVLLSIILFFKFSGGSSQESAYFLAESDYNQFRKSSDEKVQNEALERLATTLKQHEELQSKYDGLIAQVLLERNDLAKAIVYANRTLRRTSIDQLPFYGDYARTSFAIQAKHYKDALEQAQELKSSMSKAATLPSLKSFGDTLYLYNLLRIALLQEQLGLKSSELASWKEFKNAAIKGENSAYTVQPESFEKVLAQTKDGKVSLLEFIEAREKLLKS